MTLTDFEIVKKHFQASDSLILPVLDTINLNDWFETREPENYFIQLCRTIIYQQLAGKAASSIYNRFVDLIDGRIDPEHILSFSDQDFRNVGLSWAKAKYIKDLASKTLNQEIILENLHEKSDEEVITELTKVKGIGRWTAEMFLIFNLHRENIFSFGDLGLRNGFIKLYGSVDGIEKKVESWAPYKSYGSIALWHFLDNS